MINLTEKSAELESLDGTAGWVGDEGFNRLIDLLEETTEFMDEDETISRYSNFIETIYAAKLGGHQFKLWYEVRRPDTPRMILKYGFVRIG